MCSLSQWSLPFAVTLTMKQARPAAEDPSVIVALDRDAAAQNFRHFLDLLNTRIFGTTFKRHGKRLRVIAVIEHDEITRWHYHAAIDCPPHIMPGTFSAMISQCWARTDWGYRETSIKAGADDGWVRYMLKSRTKDQYDLCIDWLNFHNP
jgi:hypothetical protein